MKIQALRELQDLVSELYGNCDVRFTGSNESNRRAQEILSSLIASEEREQADRERPFDPEECGFEPALHNAAPDPLGEPRIQPAHKWINKSGDEVKKWTLNSLVLFRESTDRRWNTPWPSNHYDGKKLLELLGVDTK